jgi:signal transduction histidine kinase
VTQATSETQAPARDPLARIEQIFARAYGAELAGEARARIAALGAHASDQPRRVQLILAAELFAACWVDLASDPGRAAELVARLEEEIGLSRLDLGHEVLRSPALLQLPPAVLLDVALALLRVLAELRDVSLWSGGRGRAVRRISQVGDGRGGRGNAEAFARRLLGSHGDSERVEDSGGLLGLTVHRWGQPVAAVVARPRAGSGPFARLLVGEVEPILTAALERDDLLARSTESERALLQSSERRMARLGLDLHDGPLQELLLLSEDLRLLRGQVPHALAREDGARILEGRCDDLEAQLVALESDLRRFAASLQSPVTTRQSFRAALERIVELFASRSDIEPELSIEGDLDDLTDSQQMALLGILREGLSNVREHSGASEVRVAVRGSEEGLFLEVADNGRGFDVEQTFVRAARGGHLGLVGLHERVRLLGGSSRIASRPGGPTTIHVALPRWRPPVVAQ